MRRSVILLSFLLLLLLFCGCSIASAQSQAEINGLNYLTTTQNADGSWNEGVVTDFYNNATVLETFKLFNKLDVTFNTGLQWIQQSTSDNTDYLAKQIVLFAQNNINYQNELAQLLLRNNTDSGWGLDVNYQSENLDTVLALQALKAINYSNQTTIQSAISYLLNHQNTDGGWGFDNSDVSNLYMTAIVSRTLQQLSLTSAMATAVNKATSFIVAHQNADGGFGSSPTTVYETALAYIALAAVTTDNTVLGNAAQYITNTQAADGSWEEDPYVTALALQALYYSANKPLPPAPALASITGTVIDASTNQVLKGASAVLQSNTAINATSDASGVFTLNNIPSGSQQINISLAGYETKAITINATEGSVMNLGLIPLSVSAATGIIKGTVTDAATNQPLTGVAITVSGAFSATTTTASDGSFIFTGVTPGSITIAASFAGYATSTGMGSVVAGGVLFFNPQLSTTPPTGTTGRLIGKIVDGSTGNPVQGASVALSGGSTGSTDAQGSFAIDGITAGTYTVTITVAEYATQAYQVMILEGVTTDMGIITLTSLAGNSSTVKGVVTDSSTSQPIALADVKIAGTSLTTKTANDGSYSISGIAQLEFSVNASASGYDSMTSQLRTTAYGNYNNVDFLLNKSFASDVKINSLATDMPSYGANANVNITVALENIGATDYNLIPEGRIVDKNNNVVAIVHLQTDTGLNLPAHSVANASLMWNTAKYAPADYSIVVKFSNMADGFLLAESATSFIIRPDVLIGDAMPMVNPQFTNVKKTETVLIRGNIVNWSNVDAGLSAVCTVKDTTGAVIFNTSNDLHVPVAEFSYTFNVGSFDYTFMQSGEYPVAISILVNGATVANGAGSISVAPSIRIEPSMKLTPDIVTPDGDKTITTDIELKGVEDAP